GGCEPARATAIVVRAPAELAVRLSDTMVRLESEPSCAETRAIERELDELAAVTLTDETLEAHASVLLDAERLDAAITAIALAGAELSGRGATETVGPYRS